MAVGIINIHIIRMNGSFVSLALACASSFQYRALPNIVCIDCDLLWFGNSWFAYTVYPKKYAHGFALLCFVLVIHWLIFPYPSGLLHWHCGNLTIAPVPAKQPWWIWINTSCEFIMNDCITTTKQSTTKLCAYFLGYTVSIRLSLSWWGHIWHPFWGYLWGPIITLVSYGVSSLFFLGKIVVIIRLQCKQYKYISINSMRLGDTCASELHQNSLGQWLVISLAQNHYLNYC